MEGFYEARKVVCMESMLLGFLAQCLCHLATILVTHK